MLSGMKTEMYETSWIDDGAFDLEQEWETWNWVRAAGVSAQDLRTALLESNTVEEVN